MSDRNRELNLADALRALPLQVPEHSAWPDLAKKLKRDSRLEARNSLTRTERVRRFAIPAALAAALAPEKCQKLPEPHVFHHHHLVLLFLVLLFLVWCSFSP